MSYRTDICPKLIVEGPGQASAWVVTFPGNEKVAGPFKTWDAACDAKDPDTGKFFFRKRDRDFFKYEM